MHIVLDTDVGSDVDDALAIALIAGSPELELDGIVTVYGDTLLRARLARRYLRLAGSHADLPIAAGEVEALSGKEVWMAGHEGRLFDDLEREVVEGGGVDVLCRLVAEHPGAVDVLAIGPLTDLATALDADPSFSKNVRRFVIMGGDFRDDRIAEHNIASDVVAAQRVFTAGVPIVIGGLDLTMPVRISGSEVERIEASGPLGAILAEEIRVWWRYNDARDGEQWNTPHDPTVALWLADPWLFESRTARVVVEDDAVTRDIPEPGGGVTILSAADPTAIAAEIVRRVITASASAR